MSGLSAKSHPDLIVGTANAEDAGVFRLTADTAMVQTLDFLTPVTDDPFRFGQVAAANALSDVFAMGGRAVTAMNIVCFPLEDLPESALAETLAGGLTKIEEAGAVLVGGHSVDDLEFKYGLSVTGIVHPDQVIRNAGAGKGDVLILTKPVGSGIVATAIKGKIASDAATSAMVETMATLNRKAAEIFTRFSVHAMTDITGFGLAGHALEMARGSKQVLEIEAEKVPLLPEAMAYARMGLIPAGAYRNREFCGGLLRFEARVDRTLADLMVDPQTSGGLLAAVAETDAIACETALRDAGVEAVIIGTATGTTGCGEVVFS